MKYDLIIVGAGPAGIFAALEAVNLKQDLKIAIIEKGPKIEKRKCFIREGKKECVHCKKCGLLCGWGGAGAFSDGKLTLTPDVGGHLAEYLPKNEVDKLIKYTDDIYLKFGATTEVFGTDSSSFNEIEDQAIKAGLKLIYSPVRHLGTERSLSVLKAMQDFLEEKTDIIYNDSVKELIVENNNITGVELSSGKTIEGKKTIVAPGREGADWLSQELNRLNIKTVSNAVDIGVRVELPAAIMKHITDKLYESKLIYYSPTFGDEVRTFCMNPYGEVVAENYNGISTVNGHSYGDKRTKNTNFSLLVSKKFTEPFNSPIQYGQHVARLSNMLSGGILVQKFGDLIKGRRSTPERIKSSILEPTLKCAVPGDLSLVIPHRQMSSIIEMIYALDKIAPGVAAEHTLLYGIEVKFYSSRVTLTKDFETVGLKNLYAVGDGAGLTRGLLQASASGIKAVRSAISTL